MAFGVLREKRIRLEHFVPAISQFRAAAIALNRVAFLKKPEKNKKLSHHMPCIRYQK